jgi:hypothetical protein
LRRTFAEKSAASVARNASRPAFSAAVRPRRRTTVLPAAAAALSSGNAT